MCRGILGHLEKMEQDPETRGQPQSDPDKIAGRFVRRPNGFSLRAADAERHRYEDADKQSA